VFFVGRFLTLNKKYTEYTEYTEYISLQIRFLFRRILHVEIKCVSWSEKCLAELG